MSKEGWPINPKSFVQPNVLPLADRSTLPGSAQAPTARPAAPDRMPVRELVFFARLETRKVWRTI